MPGLDRTGPKGQGRGTGKDMGRGGGGYGQGVGFGAGPWEYCVCPSCGERVHHQPRTACFEQKCPYCGANMTRITRE